MSLLNRIGTALGLRKGIEGNVRPGPYYLPVTGGWLPAGAPWNSWQCGIDPSGGPGTAMVEACVSAYARTVAMCPGDHWSVLPNGGRERVTTSALTRILRRPNDYQSISDFLLNAVRSLYLDGNAYALALRNNRSEISSLHLMQSKSSAPVVADNGEVFYSLGGNVVVEGIVPRAVPARDVLHIRLDSRDGNPLLGTSPLEAAALDAAASGAITAQQLAFYRNQARPSQVLATDQQLTRLQVDQLREEWNKRSQGMEQGGTPILGYGLKPLQLSVNGNEAGVADMLKLSDQHIALVFGVPLQVLGIGTATYSSTEALMSQWLGQGLGFALNHIEEAFGILFGLKGQPDEYLEFNTEALLRSNFKDRVEGYARGVQGGIFAPDEARGAFELPKTPGGFGEEARVQAQVVPLSAAQGIPSAPSAPAAPAAPAAKDETKPGDNQGDPGTNAADRQAVALNRLRKAVAAIEVRHAA